MHDAIKPDLTMFLHYETLEEDGKKVVAVSIQRGTERPYYIAKKGLRPEGIYVRQGYSSVPATDLAIRQMIKETDGDHFEEMRSLNQELTFEAAQKEFELRDIEFGSQQMQTLKMIDKEGIYSNLGLLLSDQCVHTIKVAVFQGKDQEVFKDRREFSGSLLQQMNEVSHIKQEENQRPVVEQQTITTQVQKETDTKAEQVQHKENADNHQKKYDAKDKSQNEYPGGHHQGKKGSKDGKFFIKGQEIVDIDIKI